MTEYVSQAMRVASNEAAVLLYAPGADPYIEELVKNAEGVFYFDEGPRAEARIVAKSHSEDSEEPDNAGGILMILWHRREARPLEPKKIVNPMILELQAAKEILAEIFHARPEDVEKMIQSSDLVDVFERGDIG